mmetsp:Transcript_89629/g.278946  ORF Transcript_89629/g.278946 Transcript_89629/m.278946 type:complete len:309 (+) Transcript_89629:258-1184(+)
MSVTPWGSTLGSSSLKAGTLSGGGSSLRMAVWASGARASGNSMVRMRKRLPCTNGFLYVGMPSSLTAFIILKDFFASGSDTTYMVWPFRVFLADIASSREQVLKYARDPSMTKAPTSMPLRFSCVSQAFLRVSASVMSACATLSRLGQSQSSKTSHDVFASSLARGSKPWDMGFTISPGEVLMNSFLPSRCVRDISKPQRASTREILRSMKRSAPFRLKSACSCCFRTKTTSPASASGCSSAISRKTTLWPSGEPFWMCTSRTSRSCLVWKLLPCPPQAPQALCICWIMGPMRTTWTVTPRPSHSRHS